MMTLANMGALTVNKQSYTLLNRADAREIFGYIGSLFGDAEMLDERIRVEFIEYKKDRSSAQNRLQHMWFKQAEQQGDMTANEYRAQCKLEIGVPIMRSESDDFRKKYDEIVKPLNYEHKLILMVEPFDFAVTRMMNVSQMTRYLNEVSRFLSMAGIRLSHPDDLYYEAMGVRL